MPAITFTRRACEGDAGSLDGCLAELRPNRRHVTGSGWTCCGRHADVGLPPICVADESRRTAVLRTCCPRTSAELRAHCRRITRNALPPQTRRIERPRRRYNDKALHAAVRSTSTTCWSAEVRCWPAGRCLGRTATGPPGLVTSTGRDELQYRLLRLLCRRRPMGKPLCIGDPDKRLRFSGVPTSLLPAFQQDYPPHAGSADPNYRSTRPSWQRAGRHQPTSLPTAPCTRWTQDGDSAPSCCKHGRSDAEARRRAHHEELLGGSTFTPRLRPGRTGRHARRPVVRRHRICTKPATRPPVDGALAGGLPFQRAPTTGWRHRRPALCRTEVNTGSPRCP